MPMTNHLLSLLIWLPIFAGGLVVGLGNKWHDALIRRLALGFSIVILLLSLPLYINFDTSSAAMQFTEHGAWINTFNIYYSLGVDGISMPLILLTTLMTVIVIIAGWKVISERVAYYMAAFLIMEGLMIGVFSLCRCDTVLCILGSHANPDVFDYRHLGWRKSHLRHHQIFPLHLARLAVDVSGITLPLPSKRW